MVVTGATVFEPPRKQVNERLHECGIPFWPHGFVTVHCEVEQLLEHWTNEYDRHQTYSSFSWQSLPDACRADKQKGKEQSYPNPRGGSEPSALRHRQLGALPPYPFWDHGNQRELESTTCPQASFAQKSYRLKASPAGGITAVSRYRRASR